MSIIDRAKEHMEDQGISKIEVPEWGEKDKPLIIFYRPLTVADKRKLAKFAIRSDPIVFVETLILKALDSQGKNMFTIEDKRALRLEVDGEVVERIAKQIVGEDMDGDIEDIEKN